jgi:(heptosyl)LPS beta-1,4-glucosyltransferase
VATLSVVLIVKDEAANLEACLETAVWADEIVVLDAGSTDETVEIARRYTDKVFIADDWQGYGVQRQRAQSHASGDWILMLDADERITPELWQSIKQVVQADKRSSVYAVPRLSWVFGRYIRHSGWYPDYVTRLYPRERAAYGDERVHEKLHYASEMAEGRLTGDLLHYTYRDLNHYLVKSAHYAEAWATQRYEKGKKASLLQAFIHGVGCFVKMYLVRAGFLDGRQGLLLALLSAHSTFVKYADLWVRYQPAKEETKQ